jgi:pilus assembly protein CpaE
MVGKWSKLEVLHAGELDPRPGIDSPSLERVLSMARPQYEVICADLASSFDLFSLALMQESRRIFLVTTPEVTALHMAASRHSRLAKAGLADRVTLLLNRKNKSQFTDEEVAKAVGVPVGYCFSNDYAVVRSAILSGTPVTPRSGLGQCILNLAHSLAPHLPPEKTTRHRKFLEFFHVPHTGQADVVWRD